MKISPFIIVLASIILLAGCEENSEENVKSSNESSNVTLITLDDGTRCAVYSGYRKGGITCDWN